MKDTLQQSVQSFKNEMFIWEIIITVVVFAAIYFFLKAFKRKETAARERNKSFETLSDE